MFDYLQNMIKPRIIDGHMDRNEFISLLEEFSRSHGPVLHKYLDEKMHIEKEALKALS